MEEITSNKDLIENINLITFGSPRVGNSKFAKIFGKTSNVIHWRERLAGESARQIFIHYLHQDGPMYRDYPVLAYDGRPSIYHGTGQKAHRSWDDANTKLQSNKDYWRYGNSAITDPLTGKPCAKGYKKYE